MNSHTEYFSYSGAELCCEGLPLKGLADEYGTPLYVYTGRGFTERYLGLEAALGGVKHLVCYSVKSNSNIHILRLMGGLGAGMDVVSGGEIYRAMKAGVEPSRIVFAGVGKSEEEIAGAIDNDILMFNCESFREAEVINALSLSRKRVSRIALRVNPDVDADTHHYITTGKRENKFGIPLDSIWEHTDFLKGLKGIRLSGVHCHIGSQIVSEGPFVAAAEKLIEITKRLRGLGFADIGYLNLGGGFGIRYRDEEFFPIERFAEEISGRVSPMGLTLIVEPGRYLSGNNGVLLLTVLYKKRGGDKTFVVTDGAMNDLIRPSLYGAYQEILNCEKRDGSETVDVVGPVCESGDFFAKDREMGLCFEGDRLAVMSAGAYGMSMASRYNSRRLPAEVLITAEGKHRLIRRRDSLEEMIGNELV